MCLERGELKSDVSKRRKRQRNVCIHSNVCFLDINKTCVKYDGNCGNVRPTISPLSGSTAGYLLTHAHHGYGGRVVVNGDVGVGGGGGLQA